MDDSQDATTIQLRLLKCAIEQREKHRHRNFETFLRWNARVQALRAQLSRQLDKQAEREPCSSYTYSRAPQASLPGMRRGGMITGVFSRTVMEFLDRGEFRLPGGGTCMVIGGYPRSVMELIEELGPMTRPQGGWGVKSLGVCL